MINIDIAIIKFIPYIYIFLITHVDCVPGACGPLRARYAALRTCATRTPSRTQRYCPVAWVRSPAASVRSPRRAPPCDAAWRRHGRRLGGPLAVRLLASALSMAVRPRTRRSPRVAARPLAARRCAWRRAVPLRPAAQPTPPPAQRRPRTPLPLLCDSTTTAADAEAAGAAAMCVVTDSAPAPPGTPDATTRPAQTPTPLPLPCDST